MNLTKSLIPKLDSEPKARPGNLGRARGRVPEIHLGRHPSVAVIEANLQLVRITSRRGLTEAEREELDTMEDMLVYLAVEAKERVKNEFPEHGDVSGRSVNMTAATNEPCELST